MTTGNSGVSGLVLLSGLPGAGKTTFARRLAELLAADHHESDAVRFEIAGRPDYSNGESARVFGTMERRAAGSLAAGRVVIIDATNLTQRDRRRFIRVAARAGAALVAVRLTAPDITIRERLAGPREGFSEAGIDVYEQMRGRAQPFQVPCVVVDTRFPLEPSLAAVIRLLARPD